MVYLFPSIIHRIEAYLVALEACELLKLNIRPDLALEAVTKDSDNSGDHDAQKINFQHGMGNNYERLEFLGDCFLKMATSISLYGTHPDHDEYAYHVDRMMLICNKNLCSNAIKLKLYEYIRSQAFNRRAWYPEGLVMKEGKRGKRNDTVKKSHALGDKTIADVCEALIGAALLSTDDPKNMDNAVRAVTELVCSENHSVTSWSDYYKLYRKPEFQTKVATEMQRDLARQVEHAHPYRFRSPRLLRSAFIHPSYPYSYERIPNYQRLEFLGDALLDMACINFLFHQYPGKDPQWLTEHKMAMVSNQFLGCLCVELGFHTHLLIFNTAFQKQIGDYVTEITEAKTQAQDEAERAGKTREDYSPDYWISVRPPPKCLPDIVEAYVGAMFVDSEYDYSEVEGFFDAHVKRYFNDMSIYDTYANKQPTTFLTNFLQVSMGCMDWTVITKEIPSIDSSKPKTAAVVIVHETIVAEGRAESGRYAKVAAAKKALEIMKGLPTRDFRAKYSCVCRQADLEEVRAIGDLDLHGTAI
jgi:endoribonuclease Dicer